MFSNTSHSVAAQGIELIPRDVTPLPSQEANNGSVQTQEAIQQLPSSALQEPGEPSPIPAPSFSEDSSFTSARYVLPVIIRNLAKRSFRGNERINLVVDNAQNQTVNVSVTNNQGEEVEFEEFTINEGSRKTVVIKPPPHFKPGKYTIEVSSGGQTHKQDFTWGVLAINTNKSIYLPNETAKLSMAVLNEKGEVVCDAKVILNIKNQIANSEETLSTENGKIKVNPACDTRDVVVEPDYEAVYQVGATGSYKIDLSAKTPNGTYSITDSFEVADSVPFEVERVSATRIFPPNQYPVNFNIKANRDFEGTVTEIVPGNFAIDPSSSSDSSFVSPKTVSTSAVEEVLGASTSANLSLPFEGYYPISQEFGEMLRDRLEKNLYAQFDLAGHDGVDFDLPSGTKVLATDDGKIVLAGQGAYGITVAIDHSWGRSYYGHLSVAEVKVGDVVKKGDEIGLSGDTGLSTGPHLHFGIKPNNAEMENGYYGKIDPLPFLGIPSTLNPANQLKLISWNINIKKGDLIKLGYFYKAPNISPQFYKLGPLRFYEDSKKVFEETRQWQIASDAIFVKNVIKFDTNTDATSYSTASWTPSANKLYLAAVATRKTANPDPVAPTFSGNNLTWVQVNTSLRDAANARITVFRAMGASPTAGASTADFGTDTQGGVFIFIDEFDNVDTSGTNGSGAIVQSNATNGAGGTPAVGTLAAFGDATNNVTSVLGQAADAAPPLDSTYNNLANANHAGTNQGQRTAWKIGEDTTPSFGTPANGWSMVSIEIKMGKPTVNTELMRHGKWFNSGWEQPFTF